jgi:uncharacterized protein YdhG (YjbR/CyaY superfamily)
LPRNPRPCRAYSGAAEHHPRGRAGSRGSNLVKIRTYKLHSGPALYFAEWKQHYSLYPATERVVAAFNDELALYEVSKGTIRFPLSQPVPVKLIGRIAKFRAKEVAEREKAKAAAPKKR